MGTGSWEGGAATNGAPTMRADGLEERRHMAPARCRGRAAAKKGGGELVGRCRCAAAWDWREKGHGEGDGG